MASSQEHTSFVARKSFIADAALSAKMPVQLAAQGHVAAYSSGYCIGVVDKGCASGDICDVILLGPAVKVYASATGATGVIGVGDPLVAGSAGMIPMPTGGARSTGPCNAIALEAVPSGTAYIEVILARVA